MKIPIGKTITYAYSFTFGNFLTIFGLAWFPLALIGVAAYVALPEYFGALQAVVANQDFSRVPLATLYIIVFLIVMFVCFIVVYAALTRQALGLRTGPAFFYFSFDRGVRRLLLAYVLITLIMVGAIFVAALILGVFTAAVTVALGPVAGAALGAAITFVGVVGGIVFLFVRLMFLSAPVAVAEEGGILRRSWALSGGNFWRLFAVYLAIMGPFLILEIVGQVIITGFVAGPIPPGAGPEVVAAQLQQIGERLSGLLPILLPFLLVLYTGVISLMISAGAFAYRSLVPASEGIAAEFA